MEHPGYHFCRVGQLLEGGPAAVSGDVNVGDLLVGANGAELYNLPIAAVEATLVANSTLVLVLQRDSAPLYDWSAEAISPSTTLSGSEAPQQKPQKQVKAFNVHDLSSNSVVIAPLTNSRDQNRKDLAIAAPQPVGPAFRTYDGHNDYSNGKPNVVVPYDVGMPKSRPKSVVSRGRPRGGKKLAQTASALDNAESLAALRLSLRQTVPSPPIVPVLTSPQTSESVPPVSSAAQRLKTRSLANRPKSGHNYGGLPSAAPPPITNALITVEELLSLPIAPVELPAADNKRNSHNLKFTGNLAPEGHIAGTAIEPSIVVSRVELPTAGTTGFNDVPTTKEVKARHMTDDVLRHKRLSTSAVVHAATDIRYTKTTEERYTKTWTHDGAVEEAERLSMLQEVRRVKLFFCIHIGVCLVSC